jgi:DNA-binding protein
MNNHQKLIPVEPIKKLKYNEIGVKSDVKGNDLKNLIDKVIFILIYKNYPNVTLKSRGKGTSKLISIIDILRRKILGLYVQQKTYSTSYINESNKEIKIPSMDAIFLLRKPDDNTNFFSHQEFVRNSSPYVTEHEKKVLEEKNNKKKFLNKNGFITSVGNYSMKPHYIENYVQQTPSEFPLNHKFREEDKEKWMTPKGFIK